MKKTSDYLSINDIFKKFVNETANGKRLQKNGKIVAKSTLKNYNALLINLIEFSEKANTNFEIDINYKHSKRKFESEKRRYNKFYKQFTDFLYT